MATRERRIGAWLRECCGARKLYETQSGGCHFMLNLLIGNGKSTKSEPKPCTVCVSKGWKNARKIVVLSCMGAVGMIQVEVAAAIIAKAKAALMRRGYSLAWKVFHVPSGFLHIRMLLGVTGCFHCTSCLAMAGRRMATRRVGLTAFLPKLLWRTR